MLTTIKSSIVSRQMYHQVTHTHSFNLCKPLSEYQIIVDSAAATDVENSRVNCNR